RRARAAGLGVAAARGALRGFARAGATRRGVGDLAVVPGRLARRVGGRLDGDVAAVLGAGGAGDRRGELAGDRARDLEVGLVGADADRADLVAGDVPTAAQQRQDPARVGVLAAADVHAEPDHVVEAFAAAVLAVGLARLGGIGDQLLDLRHRRAVRADQRGGDVLGAALGEQARGERAVLVVELDRREQRREQALAVAVADRLGARRIDPLGLDPGAAQHGLDAPAAGVGDDQHRGALLARAAGAARAMLQGLGIARDLDVDHQAQRRQVDAARGDVG